MLPHIVYSKGASSPYERKNFEQSNLKLLFQKAAKLGAKAKVVSALWVNCCVEEQTRAKDDDFLISEPFLPLVTRTPCSLPSKTKKRKSLAPRPIETYTVDVDDPLFSSTQLLSDPSPKMATLPISRAKRKRQKHNIMHSNPTCVRG
eukprot:jgi/Botrbrau1/833/Bobra.0352s0030.2